MFLVSKVPLYGARVLMERQEETSPEARRRAEWLPPQDAATT